jgi:hypothetical protein
MTKFKLGMAAAAAAVLAFGVAACGQTTATTEPAADATTEAPADTTAPADPAAAPADPAAATTAPADGATTTPPATTP